jgi:hypothetical protein
LPEYDDPLHSFLSTNTLFRTPIATDTHKTWKFNTDCWTHVTVGHDNLDKPATYNPACNHATGAGTQHLVSHDSFSIALLLITDMSRLPLWFSIQKSSFRCLFFIQTQIRNGESLSTITTFAVPQPDIAITRQRRAEATDQLVSERL